MSYPKPQACAYAQIIALALLKQQNTSVGAFLIWGLLKSLAWACFFLLQGVTRWPFMICICVCVYLHLHVCVRICACACVWVWLCVCVCASMVHVHPPTGAFPTASTRLSLHWAPASPGLQKLSLVQVVSQHQCCQGWTPRSSINFYCASLGSGMNRLEINFKTWIPSKFFSFLYFTSNIYYFPSKTYLIFSALILGPPNFCHFLPLSRQ